MSDRLPNGQFGSAPKAPRIVTPEQEAACPPGARIIPLTKGYVAWVDEADHDWLAVHCWRAQRDSHRIYAVRWDKGHKIVRMHREVCVTPRHVLVDHRVDRSPEGVCDNRRSNLRPATNGQNVANGRKRRNTTSVFRGVSWHKAAKKWTANIRVNKKLIHLGFFAVEAHAAYVRDLAAVESFGEFAVCSFPVPGATRWLFGPGGIQEAR